ncbi:hypothetical protein L1987_18571 [Smallanthus sonchifolius]|uniref:Uncharacterized protein n=1 Tax=Smallanthus sonchifolius TaxID=185202 RepID=A0ACB9J256_9ASTR|nr:hypothetical protein L1987_18571 [Smallanthus sonchifolius]
MVIALSVSSKTIVASSIKEALTTEAFPSTHEELLLWNLKKGSNLDMTQIHMNMLQSWKSSFSSKKSCFRA